MMIEKLAGSSLDAVERASRLAVKRGDRNVTQWHLLAALLDGGDGAVRALLGRAAVDLVELAGAIESRLAAQPRARPGEVETPINRGLERVFIHAEDRAASAGGKKIELPHLLHALVEDSEVAGAVEDAGARRETLVALIAELRAPQRVPVANAPAAPDGDADADVLARYTRDLTEAARRGAIDPLVGRDAEVRLTIEILSRRQKNNPILVGEPGVGKTAIVEGLARAIVAGHVPDELQRCRLLALDLGQVVAGARYRGEFEERLQKILAEVIAQGNVILFIDEIHAVVGAGSAEGSMDAANLLKPALSRGALRCMGATTTVEYRRRIQKDSALMRRFQVVDVREPTIDETISMLRGLKEKYELHHGVRLLDEAIVAAAKLGKRYLTDRFLPDKAFDLLDQAAASVRLRVSSKPEPLEELDRRIITLEIESHALESESSPAVQRRLAAVKSELERLQKESGELSAKWRREKGAIELVRAAKRELEAALREKEQCIAGESFARVAELQYKVIPACEKVLAEYADVDVAGARLLDAEVGEREVAAAVSRITGIPAESIVESEKERLMQLESHLRRRVVGQDEAVTAVAKAVRRARAGVQSPTRPIASFLMLGPTGVGKTELARALAEFLFDDDKAMVRLDMSEYMEKHSAALLVGAPPGYVGYEAGGVLTNKVRRRPYSVVLFDEVEKGHPDVYHLFLQLLDEGRLTDSQGQTVDFTNTIVLMTSNLGSEHIRVAETPEDRQAMTRAVLDAVRARFRPEFLNRLDDLLLFNTLTPERMKPIVDIQLARLSSLLRDRHLELDVRDGARALLAEVGYNPVFGARPLQRAIQTLVQDALAEQIVSGAIAAGQTVVVDAVDGRIEVARAGETRSAA